MKIPNYTRWIIIISLIYFLFLIILFYNEILKPTSNFLDISLGLGTGLIAWLLTQGMSKWLDQDEKKKLETCLEKVDSIKHTLINYKEKDFPPHKDVTTTILNVVQKKYLSLINKSRNNLDKNYYNELYDNVLRLRLSGIAVKRQIKTLNEIMAFFTKEEYDNFLSTFSDLNPEKILRPFVTKKDNKVYVDLGNIKDAEKKDLGEAFNEIIKHVEINNPLINSLMNNENVRLEILIADPESEFVHHRDKIEENIAGESKNCSKAIEEIISLLKEITDKYKDIKTRAGNSLLIKKTTVAMNLAITHVQKKENEKDSEILLMGFIFDHALGNQMPMYQIPTDYNNSDTSLYDGCINNFNKIFLDAERIFVWNENGPKFINGS